MSTLGNGTGAPSSTSEEDWKDADFVCLNDSAADEAESIALVNKEDSSNQRRYVIRQNESSLEKSLLGSELSHHWPPWKNLSEGGSPGLVTLHNEIVDFVSLMEPQQEEVEVREDVIRQVTNIIHQAFGGSDNCKVEVFGSHATSLFLPHSDIDLVVYCKDKTDIREADSSSSEAATKTSLTVAQQERIDMENWSIHTSIASHQNKSPYAMLADALRNEWGSKLSYLEVIENTRVPLVKFTHKPTNLSLDVCFNQEGGPEAAALMNQWLDDLPPLRPLCFVLKYFLACRGLNETYTGGIGSYALQLMIVSFLQQRTREEYNLSSAISSPQNSANLGSMMLEFLELYGIDFNYVTVGISLRSGGYYFPKGSKDKSPFFWQPSRPFSLAIENPLDTTHDVGKGSYRMMQIQKSLEVAFRTLLTHVSEPAVPTESILATILPPTKEMVKRSVLRGVLQQMESRIKQRPDKSQKRRREESDYAAETSYYDSAHGNGNKRRSFGSGYSKSSSALQNQNRGYRM